MSTAGNNTLFLDAANPGIVGLGLGNDRYVLSPTNLTAGQRITISDADGTNTLQLVGGLAIASSQVSNNAIQLTLTNGAVVTVLGASTFTFLTGGDAFTGTGGLSQTFSQFVTVALGSTVPAAGAPAVNVGPVTLVSGGAVGPVAGQTFTLTANATADIPSLTAGTDTIDATTVLNSLSGVDFILDSSTTDADVLNARVTVNNANPTITRIENINVAANILTTGLALTNVTGTKVLTLTSPNATSTATVSDAAFTRAESIVAGTNIGTLNVTTIAAGTAGTLAINGGDATAINVTGAAGTDTLSITTKAGSTTTLATLAAPDAVTLNLTGGTSTLAALGGLANNLTIVSGGAANTLNGAGVDAIGTAAVTATNAITLTSTAASLTGDTITKTGTGVLTVAVGAGAGDYSKIAADILQVTADVGGVLTANNNSVVLLTGTQTNASTFKSATSDSVNFTIGAAQTLLKTDATVTNTNITSNADTRVIGTLEVKAGATATQSVAVQGTNQLTITSFDGKAGSSIVNIGTGKLVVTGSVDAVTVIGGTGIDEIGGSANADRLVGNGGNDILSGLAGNDTILGGDGADNINGGVGADSMTGGAGDDVFVIATSAVTKAPAPTAFALGDANSNNIDRITDFTGNGAAAGDSIQLGTGAAAFVAAASFVATGAVGATVANVTASTIATAATFNDFVAGLSMTASTAAIAQVYDVTVTAGALAGRYLVVNDGIAAFAITDAVINITGSTGALNAQDFIFG